jgi:hypothetical protein
LREGKELMMMRCCPKMVEIIPFRLPSSPMPFGFPHSFPKKLLLLTLEKVEGRKEVKILMNLNILLILN